MIQYLSIDTGIAVAPRENYISWRSPLSPSCYFTQCLTVRRCLTVRWAWAWEALFRYGATSRCWFDKFTSLFSPKVIVAGLVRESFPTEACLCGHQCFSVVAQATAKIRPRPAQVLLSKEQLCTGIAGVNGRWGQVVEETACCHSAPSETWKVTLDNWQCGAYLVNDLRMSAVKCSNLRQAIIHSPHHVLETFRPF